MVRKKAVTGDWHPVRVISHFSRVTNHKGTGALDAGAL
jgi:hypothetical protein